MSGQPQDLSLSFDVTSITATEPAGSNAPATIVAAGQSFDLSAEFDGSGLGFLGFEAASTAWTIQYFAEGIGAGAPVVDLGAVNGTLLPAGGPYTAPATTLSVAAGTLPVGVYNIACLVTFPTVPGMTGFVEGLVIQVY